MGGRQNRRDGSPRGRSPPRERRDQSPQRRDSSSTSRSRQVTGTSPSGRKNAKPCADFKREKCTKGYECKFWHPPKCRYYAKGTCKDGENCVFIHEKPANPATTSQSPSPKAKARGRQRSRSPERAIATSGFGILQASGNGVPGQKGNIKKVTLDPQLEKRANAH